MSTKLCAMCIENRVKGKNTFCNYCYFNNKEFVDELLLELKKPGVKRPSWLKYMEADTEREKRRLEKERVMGQNWNE